jgi:NAD(P)H-dependent FMN reductase
MIKIGIIIASTRPNRRGDKIGRWYINQLPKIEEVKYELIDLKEENLPFLHDEKSPAEADYNLESTKRWSKKIDQLDGYIWIMPEYNHGYSATQKNAIDTVYREWQKKPVAFLGYGFMGAARAIQQMIGVTARVGMVPLSLATINIIDINKALDEDGSVNKECLRGDPKRQMDTLVKWAKLLKKARSEDLI